MRLESLELGKFFHQLFYAVLLKLYCNLGIVPIALAAKDGAHAVFGMADARALALAMAAHAAVSANGGEDHRLEGAGEVGGQQTHRPPSESNKMC